MKTQLLIIFCLLSFYCPAQTKYQVSLGYGRSFIQKVNMKTGNIGLKFLPDKNVFVDVNKKISIRHKLSLGIHLKLNLAFDIFELDKAIPYYSEKESIILYMVESVEANIYLKKYFELYNKKNLVIQFFAAVAPAFNINEGNTFHNVFSLRDDNMNRSFQVSKIEEKAQKLYIPYLRITGGVEILKKVSKRHPYYLGLNPFITWAGLQSEKNNLTVFAKRPHLYFNRQFFTQQKRLWYKDDFFKINILYCPLNKTVPGVYCYARAVAINDFN